MSLTYYKNRWAIPLFIASIFLASVILFQTIAKAADEAQIQEAIKDLSSATGQKIVSQDQAKEICNQEQYLDVCADIGKKHNLYTSEEVKQVDSFLDEVKGKILDDIKSCADEECLVKVANDLAKKIQVKNPALAVKLNLTTSIVAEKQSVVQAAKEAGVNFKDCESMDPDTAPVDLLRKCAKLAKDTRVQKYIPEEKRILADQFGDTTIKLREALSAGKYQCGDNTLEGCGNFCLNPDTTTRAAGISVVCKQIASEIFGQEGVKHLEASYQQVGQVKDYYSNKFILTLPNGKELVGENQIRTNCDQAFSSRNLEIAKACGSFAVKNGFTSQEEVEKGLKLMESFVQKGQNVNFDECLTNPMACRDFIPDDEKERFDASSQIFEIMKSEIGFDPSQCERGAVDETIGTKCSEGSKRALAKIESLGLANQSKEARFIIEDIKSHVSEGENRIQRKDEFRQVFSQQGGPGGCKSEAECYTYCSNSTNGPECIAFGSKQNISGFRGQEAVQKFQEYNQNLQRPGLISDEYRPFPPGGDVIYPPGQDPRFTQPGPGFSPPPGTGSYYPPYPGGQGPAGPAPECFAAIQSGDFVRAKTVCYVPPQPTGFPTPQICQASPYVECPTNQFRESFRNSDGCWVDGPCRPAPIYSPGPYPTGPNPYPTYSPRPTFTPSGDPALDCQKSGGTWDPATKYCKFPEPSYSPYPTGSYQPCPLGQWWDSSIQSCKKTSPSDTPPPGTSPYPTYSPGPGTGSCPSGYHYHGESGSFCMNDQENYSGTCYDSGGTSKITCPAQPTYSPSPYPSSSPTSSGSCPSGAHIIYVNNAGGYCMSDSDGSKCGPLNSTSASSFGTCSGYQTTATYSPGPGASYTPSPTCPSGQWWDTATSRCTSTATSCGTGYYWDSASSICKPSDSTTYTPYPTTQSCPSGQWWDPAISSCKSTTINDTPYPTTQYTPYSTTQYTPPPSCPSNQYWDGSACVSSTTYTPYPTTEYTPPSPTSSLYNDYIVAHCQQLNRTWDGSRCQANGRFARFYENNFASILRLFYIVP